MMVGEGENDDAADWGLGPGAGLTPINAAVNRALEDLDRVDEEYVARFRGAISEGDEARMLATFRAMNRGAFRALGLSQGPSPASPAGGR